MGLAVRRTSMKQLDGLKKLQILAIHKHILHLEMYMAIRRNTPNQTNTTKWHTKKEINMLQAN